MRSSGGRLKMSFPCLPIDSIVKGASRHYWRLFYDFMKDRLALIYCATRQHIEAVINSEMNLLVNSFPLPNAKNSPLNCCIDLIFNAGLVAVVAQRRVRDPDFSAEHAAYYSEQFRRVPQTCTRVHFFLQATPPTVELLTYLDSVSEDSYLGFITLRPIPRAPVGATILSARVAGSNVVCSLDNFPVHISGKSFEIEGTPFMQQDNAVAVCAQASIWVALRTLRRREGDRAHNPAQITDAATKYLISDRTRPNKSGLTIHQMAEAVRAAGYSPLLMRLVKDPKNHGPAQITEVRKRLQSYIESNIPVLLALYPGTGGHAVVAVGHTWETSPSAFIYTPYSSSNIKLDFTHASTWAPKFLIHNDNSGPYQELPPQSGSGYALSQAHYAIPLMPTDVFMTADEALLSSSRVLGKLLEAAALKHGKTTSEIQSIAKSLVVRLLLVEKRRLRHWAANEPMPTELSTWLRIEDLPRRVWLLEIHLAAGFGARPPASSKATMVGMILIDPTSDFLDGDSNILMSYLDLQTAAGFGGGALAYGYPITGLQTTNHHPIKPMPRAK